MKKILKIILILCAVYVFIPINMKAYTTSSNITMTDKEYEKLVNIFGEEYIEVISEETFAIVHNQDPIEKETKYYRIMNHYDKNGNIDESYEIEISKEEYDLPNATLFNSCQVSYDENLDYKFQECWETSSKKLALITYGSDGSNNLYGSYYAILQNWWKTMPSTRSYDLIGVRGHYVLFNDNSLAQVIFTRNGNIYTNNYSNTSSNYKNLGNYEEGGFAYSMPLPTGTITNLQVATAFYYKPYQSSNYGASSLIVGAYQHATKNVTLADSLSFEPAAVGKGGIFLFNNQAIADSYDNMQGISRYWSY